EPRSGKIRRSKLRQRIPAMFHLRCTSRRRACRCSLPLSKSQKSAKPHLELLEDRTLLAVNPFRPETGMAGPLVDGYYQLLLGRSPQNGEEVGWIDALRYGTQTAAQEAAGFLSSPEYALRVVDD